MTKAQPIKTEPYKRWSGSKEEYDRWVYRGFEIVARSEYWPGMPFTYTQLDYEPGDIWGGARDLADAVERIDADCEFYDLDENGEPRE